MKTEELKRLHHEAEQKCKRELLYFALLCLVVFLVAPIALVVSIRYDEEIDNFFDFKTQVVLFLTSILVASIIFLYRWFKR